MNPHPTGVHAEDTAATAEDISTQLIHHRYQPPQGFSAVMPGVHKASTVLFPNVAALHAREWKSREGYTYGLHGTPSSFTLEARLATLEGGRHCLLAPSGLAALTLVNVAMLKPGDQVLLPGNVYGPSLDMARSLLADWGMGHALYDPLDAADLAAKLGPAVKLVWLEAAGSVTLEFPDLVGLVAAARTAGVPTALDNTWGAGLAFNGFDLGIDIVMQALTKYPSGGADVLMGSVVTRDQALFHRLLAAHGRLGLGVGANDVEAVLRGLPSMALRYAAQDASARRIAHWLQARPEVAQVLHPALEGSPGHGFWQAQARGAAGLVSLKLRQPEWPRARVHRFIDALRRFGIGYSWGGPMSLAVPYELAAMREGGGPLAQGTLVRLAIGLEHPADLEADLAQALAQA